MKIIDATWEKRNLGVNCREIEIESSDEIASVVEAISSSEQEYMVAKVPSSMTEMGFAVQRCGFKYIETNIRLTKLVKGAPHLPGIYKRYEDAVAYHKASPQELKQIVAEIDSGKIFTTDKVSRDPYFSCEASGQRYALWTMDVMNSGAGNAYVVTYEGKSIGFIITVDKETYIDAFLAGLFVDSLDSGLGLFVIGSIEKIVFDAGKRKIITGVSSNNPSVLRLYMLLGYTISELTANYIKHIEI